MLTGNRDPLLVLTGVSRSYGPLHALKPVDLTVLPAQCIALLGVNGSGKSTLLRQAAAGGRTDSARRDRGGGRGVQYLSRPDRPRASDAGRGSAWRRRAS